MKNACAQGDPISNSHHLGYAYLRLGLGRAKAETGLEGGCTGLRNHAQIRRILLLAPRSCVEFAVFIVHHLR